MHYADWLLSVNKGILAWTTCITHVPQELCIKHIIVPNSFHPPMFTGELSESLPVDLTFTSGHEAIQKGL